MNHLTHCALIAAIVLPLAATESFAGPVGVAELFPAPTDGPRDNFTGGLYGRLTANPADPLITHVGYVDSGEDGLNVAHEVGLYEWNGSAYVLQQKATVPAGTTGILSGGFRWVELPTPVIMDLDSDNFYVVGSTNVSGSGDIWGNNTPANSVTDPDIATIGQSPGFAVGQSSLGTNTGATFLAATANGTSYVAGNIGFAIGVDFIDGADVIDGTSTFTTDDGYVTLNAIANDAPGTFGGGAGRIGITGGNSNGGINDDDGNPATTNDRQLLEIVLDSPHTMLRTITWDFSRADGPGLLDGVAISGFASDPGAVGPRLTDVRYDDGTGTLFFEILNANFGGDDLAVWFTNPHATLGQTLTIGANDSDQPNAQFAIVSLGYSVPTPAALPAGLAMMLTIAARRRRRNA